MLSKLKSFEYVVPQSIDELTEVLLSCGNAKILAGGTDLLVAMKICRCHFPILVNIKSLSGLSYIEFDEQSSLLRIGALTTISDLENSAVVRERFAVLWQAASRLATPQVKNMATIGGNLCNASPAADIPPALLALKARVKVHGPDGDRMIPIEDFFVGPCATALKKTETLIEIEVDAPPPNATGHYIKYCPARSSDLALVNVAVLFEMEEDGRTCASAKVALGAVAPRPMRCLRAEEFLTGRELNEKVLVEAREHVCTETRPIDDIRGSIWYRREMVKSIFERAANLALKHKDEGGVS